MALLEVYPEMVRRTLEGPPVSDEEAQNSGFFQEYLSQMHSLTKNGHFPEKYRRHYLKKYRNMRAHPKYRQGWHQKPSQSRPKGRRLYLWLVGSVSSRRRCWGWKRWSGDPGWLN